MCCICFVVVMYVNCHFFFFNLCLPSVVSDKVLNLWDWPFFEISLFPFHSPTAMCAGSQMCLGLQADILHCQKWVRKSQFKSTNSTIIRPRKPELIKRTWTLLSIVTVKQGWIYFLWWSSVCSLWEVREVTVAVSQPDLNHSSRVLPSWQQQPGASSSHKCSDARTAF